MRRSKEYFDYRKEMLTSEEIERKTLSEVLETEGVPRAASVKKDMMAFLHIEHDEKLVLRYRAMEDLAITRVEADLGQRVQRNVRLTRDSETVIVDGLVQESGAAPDKIVEVKWFRQHGSVRRFLETVPQLLALVDRYRRITGRNASLVLVLVVPEPRDEHRREVLRALEQVREPGLGYWIYTYTAADLGLMELQ